MYIRGFRDTVFKCSKALTHHSEGDLKASSRVVRVGGEVQPGAVAGEDDAAGGSLPGAETAAEGGKREAARSVVVTRDRQNVRVAASGARDEVEQQHLQPHHLRQVTACRSATPAAPPATGNSV